MLYMMRTLNPFCPPVPWFAATISHFVLSTIFPDQQTLVYDALLASHVGNANITRGEPTFSSNPPYTRFQDPGGAYQGLPATLVYHWYIRAPVEH